MFSMNFSAKIMYQIIFSIVLIIMFHHQAGAGHFHYQNNRPGQGQGQGQGQEQMIRGPNGQFNRNPQHQGQGPQFNPDFGPNSNHPNFPHGQAQPQVQMLDLNSRVEPEAVYSYEVEFEYLTRDPNEIRTTTPDDLDMGLAEPLWYQKLHPEIYGPNPENRPENKYRFSPLPMKMTNFNNGHPKDLERLLYKQSDDEDYQKQEYERVKEELDRDRVRYYTELNKRREETARKNAEIARQKAIQEAFERHQREEEAARQQKESAEKKPNHHVVSKEKSAIIDTNSKDNQDLLLYEKLPTAGEKEDKKTNHHRHVDLDSSEELTGDKEKNSDESDLDDDKSNHNNKLYFTSSIFKFCIMSSIHFIMIQYYQ